MTCPNRFVYKNININLHTYPFPLREHPLEFTAPPRSNSEVTFYKTSYGSPCFALGLSTALQIQVTREPH